MLENPKGGVEEYSGFSADVSKKEEHFCDLLARMQVDRDVAYEDLQTHQLPQCVSMNLLDHTVILRHARHRSANSRPS